MHQFYFQLSAAQSESEALMSQVREKDSQLEELHQARDLLASDAQVSFYAQNDKKLDKIFGNIIIVFVL